jgi:hypothetical protein
MAWPAASGLRNDMRLRPILSRQVFVAQNGTVKIRRSLSINELATKNMLINELIIVIYRIKKCTRRYIFVRVPMGRRSLTLICYILGLTFDHSISSAQDLSLLCFIPEEQKKQFMAQMSDASENKSLTFTHYGHAHPTSKAFSNMDHPAYSPDFALRYSFLFGYLKEDLAGQSFCQPFQADCLYQSLRNGSGGWRHVALLADNAWSECCNSTYLLLLSDPTKRRDFDSISNTLYHLLMVISSWFGDETAQHPERFVRSRNIFLSTLGIGIMRKCARFSAHNSKILLFSQHCAHASAHVFKPLAHKI